MSTSPTFLPHPLARCVAEVGAAVDEAVGCDPVYMPASERGELVVELHRQVERLKSLELRLLNACEDLAIDEGARSVADWCEAHHKTSWTAHGGCTDVDDGVLLCPWHHHRAHDTAYLVKYLPNGDVRYRRRT